MTGHPEHEGTAPTLPSGQGRVGGLLLAFALGLGATGFLVATGHELQPEPPVARAASAPPGAAVDGAADAATGAAAGAALLREAPRYRDLRPGELGANAAWRARVAPEQLAGPGPAERIAFFGAPPATEAERAHALLLRDERRAYRGAPPVVPHSIDQTGTLACLACHQHGFRAGDVVVPPMSHGPLASCTQCHVEASGAPPLGPGRARGSALLAASAFEGLPEPGPGTRAWPGAPPTIPHPTWMRQSCAACHGTLATPGLAASHPWRTSCTQCHAPSAELDQVPVRRSPLTVLE